MPKRSDARENRGQFISGSARKAPVARKQPTKWDLEARAILRGEMQRRGFTYKRLALALERDGEPETERRLISRVTRGTFSFGFTLRCLRAMGAERVSVGPV